MLIDMIFYSLNLCVLHAFTILLALRYSTLIVLLVEVVVISLPPSPAPLLPPALR